VTPFPSGEQHEIAFEDQRAVVVEVGGAVRRYDVGGREVLEPFDVDAMCDGAHGTPLIPWPNRLGGGRYTWDGTEHQVALTEPEQSNAIHGFLRWRPWTVADRADHHVTMAARIFPMKGYPFHLDVQVAYRLGPDGLTVTTTASNVGGEACPYASGHHPYLSPGSGLIDEAVLEVPAETRIDTDERQLPTTTETVDGTPYDFREPRRLGHIHIDYAFGGIRWDDQDRATVRLRGEDGLHAELWIDRSYRYLEIFTGDTLGPGRRRTGLGVEPMTCPPNGFATGDDVVRLEPGTSHVATWGARLV